MRTRIQISGLTRPEDVRLAARLGVDAIGFAFGHGQLPLTAEQAQLVSSAMPPWVNRVAVVGAPMKAQAAMFAEACRLDTIQLMGPADPAFCAYYRGRFTMIQALALAGKDASALQAEIEAIAPHVDGIMLQADGAPDAGVLKAIESPVPLMVGGLSPETVRGALAAQDLWGIEVGEALHARPGMLDGAKLMAFLGAMPRS